MRYRYLLIIILPMACLLSCKKSSKTPDSGVTVIGKWFLKKQNSGLFYNGAEISVFVKASFTTNDFVEYDAGGTGFFSQNSAYGGALTQFNYTLKDSLLTIYEGANAGTILTTITTLTASNMVVRAQQTIADPNNQGQFDTEVDTLAYAK